MLQAIKVSKPRYFVPDVPARVVLLLAAIVAVTGQSQVRAQDADEVLDRLRARYDEIDGLRAEFVQTMDSEYLDTPESSSGMVVLSGKQIRIETARQTFVTDGTVTWLYDADAREVLVNDYVEEEMFPVREFLFDYDQDYEVVSVRAASVGGTRVHVISLRAREDANPYREIQISVRDADDVINRLEILDVNETRMTFELTDIVLNPPLEADTFSFIPPENTEVIDLRS